MTETSPTPLQARLIVLAACLIFVAGACGGTDDDSTDVLVADGSQFLGDYALIDEDFGTDVTVSDWVFTPGSGNLDECNGAFVDGEYVYFITNDYPYIPRCLMGEVESGAGDAAPTADRPGTPPNFTDAASALGVTEAELIDILPRPAEPLDDAAAALGVTVDELKEILPRPPSQ